MKLGITSRTQLERALPELNVAQQAESAFVLGPRRIRRS
jgi:hypothetical protein